MGAWVLMARNTFASFVCTVSLSGGMSQVKGAACGRGTEEGLSITSHFARHWDPLWCRRCPRGLPACSLRSGALGALASSVAKVATEVSPLPRGCQIHRKQSEPRHSSLCHSVEGRGRGRHSCEARDTAPVTGWPDPCWPLSSLPTSQRRCLPTLPVTGYPWGPVAVQTVTLDALCLPWSRAPQVPAQQL